MKIDRLLGIVTILLRTERMTASDLAETFEVSRRTINRDIEDICKAGIPLATWRGPKGGVSILDGYKIDKALLNPQELKAILSGLYTLDSVAQDRRYQAIIDKFMDKNTRVAAGNSMVIDLSSHYRDTLSPKIGLIHACIETYTVIQFDYYNQNGHRHVRLHPYLLLFQWSNWYVFGAIDQTSDFRLYKLNRLWKLQATDQSFVLQPIPQEQMEFNQYFTDEIQALVLFEENTKYRLIEEYGIDSFTTLPDGRLQFQFPFTSERYLLEWVLSFGSGAQLLEPSHLRAKLKSELEISLSRYVER